MTGNTGSFGLNSLGPSDLQSFGRNITVERHILRFKRRRMIAILSKDPAKTGGDDTLADIGSRTYKHQGPE
jgi:hypothetical protein